MGHGILEEYFAYAFDTDDQFVMPGFYVFCVPAFGLKALWLPGGGEFAGFQAG